MNPIDYRNVTFRDLQARLTGDRLTVLEALRAHGPCTTRELSTKMSLDLLSVRPRITELVQLGFADCLDKPGHEGIYAALSDHQAVNLFTRRQDSARNPQLQLSLP